VSCATKAHHAPIVGEAEIHRALETKGKCPIVSFEFVSAQKSAIPDETIK
jgi:hypothetical protein